MRFLVGSGCLCCLLLLVFSTVCTERGSVLPDENDTWNTVTGPR